jgi:solute carrier family 25 folate transporter 32
MSFNFDNEASKRAVAPLLAGLLGGAVSTVALYPLDLIKVRLQVNEDAPKGVMKQKNLTSWRVFRAVIRYEGIGGLYQGLLPAVIGSSVSWGGYFFVYEAMKRRYGQYKDPLNTDGIYYFNAWENFVLACTSGAILVGLTNPVWLIKTRMQLQMKHVAKERGMKSPYTGMLDAGRTIVKEEGIMALYNGAFPALLLTSHGGVQFVVYEYLKQYFNYRKAGRDPSLTVADRFQFSLGYLTIGAVAKM